MTNENDNENESRLERHARRWQRALVALAMTGDLAIRSYIDDGGVATTYVQCMGVWSSGEDGDFGGPVLRVARELARRAALAAEEFDEEPEGAES